MLGKLIKYEFKATGRSILPMYLALVLLSIINKIFWGAEGLRAGIANFGGIGKFIGVITMMLYVFIFIAAVVMTVVIVIQRFYKNLLKDEGYLMNTLPVTPSMNVASKLITSVIWIIICAVISSISIFILAYYPHMFSEIFSGTAKFFNYGISELGGTFFLYIIECIALMILGIVMAILMVYASIVIGHLAHKNKILASIASFIGLKMILDVFSTIGVFAIQGIYTATATNVASSGDLEIVMNSSEKTTVSNVDIQIILLIIILGVAVISAVFFFISSYIMKNKLNLE